MEEDEDLDAPAYALSVPPRIFDLIDSHEPVPDGFNAVVIRLDGRMRSLMDWNAQKEAASRFAGRGYKILWDIDLGLFHALELPMDNQMQFDALSLSLDHFYNQFWSLYQDQTVGVSLYRGELDLPVFHSEEPHESMLAAAEYLDLLANKLPEEIPAFALVDAGSISDPFRQAILASKERHPRLSLFIKGMKPTVPHYAWEGERALLGFIGRSPHCVFENALHTAICLPSGEMEGGELKGAMEQLAKNGIIFKAVPESYLLTEWEGLDYIICSAEAMTFQGVRKLQGFCAAGGTVVQAGEGRLDLSSEITLDEFLRINDTLGMVESNGR